MCVCVCVDEMGIHRCARRSFFRFLLFWRPSDCHVVVVVVVSRNTHYSNTSRPRNCTHAHTHIYTYYSITWITRGIIYRAASALLRCAYVYCRLQLHNNIIVLMYNNVSHRVHLSHTVANKIFINTIIYSYTIYYAPERTFYTTTLLCV
jgi:hypothetical protein